MKKVIRLTESDLVRLVKKIVNEQDEPKKFIPGVRKDVKPTKMPKSHRPPDPVGKIENRPFDKMVAECLKKDGYTVKLPRFGVGILEATKKTPQGEHTVKSLQGNPSKYLYTLKTPDGRIASSDFSVNSSSTCESIVP